MHVITVDAPDKAILYKKAAAVVIPLTVDTKQEISEMRNFYK